LRMPSNSGRACCRFPFRGELLLVITQLHLVVRITRDASAVGNPVSTDKKKTGARWRMPLAPCFSSGVLSEIGLGFATPRRLGKHSQRIRSLGAASLLKLIDPVGHGLHHVARRFTCGRW